MIVPKTHKYSVTMSFISVQAWCYCCHKQEVIKEPAMKVLLKMCQPFWHLVLPRLTREPVILLPYGRRAMSTGTNICV